MKIIRRSIILALVLVFSLSIKSYAQDIFLVVDGQIIESGAQPFIENGRTLVPVRFVAESLGYDVSWEATSKTVTISDPKSSKKIELIVNSKTANVYDKNSNLKQVKLETPAINTYNRVFVPVRFVAETFNIAVNWDDAYNVVILGDQSKYDEEDLKYYIQSLMPVSIKDLGATKVPVTYFYLYGVYYSDHGTLMISSDDIEPRDGFDYYARIDRENKTEGFYIKKTPDPQTLEIMYKNGKKSTIEVLNLNAIKYKNEVFIRSLVQY